MAEKERKWMVKVKCRDCMDEMCKVFVSHPFRLPEHYHRSKTCERMTEEVKKVIS